MATAEVAQVFIVDDHPLMRQGLRRLIELEEALAVTGEASSGEEALVQIAEHPPDIALVDISMPGMNGIECTSRLMRNDSNVKVLIVSTFDGAITVRNALDAGAHGYLLKANADDLIGTAVGEVLAGRRYLCPVVRRKLDV